MKKNLIVALALVFVLGIAGTAFAAANPFVDVPAKHWAYDAVTKLAQAGILDGYGDGTYRGERLATRYEMAQATAKAMARADKADAQMKGLIDKLAVEFAAELNNLGVRVAKLEKNASTIKFTGDARVRYQSNYNLAGDNNTAGVLNRFQERLRVNAVAQVNDNITFTGRLMQESTTGVNSGVADAAGTTAWEIGNFKWQSNPTTYFQIGRSAPSVGQGILYGTTGMVDGIEFGFGDPLKVVVGYGDVANKIGTTVRSNTNAAWVTYLNLTYQASKQWNVWGSLWYSNDNDNAAIAPTASAATMATYQNGTATAPAYSGYPFQNWALGFNLGLNSDWGFQAAYVNNSSDKVSNAFSNDSHYAWLAKLQYLGAKPAQVGSWGANVTYRDVKPFALDWSVASGILGNDVSGANALTALYQGVKGLGFEVAYTPAKNLVLTATYLRLSRNNANNSDNYAPVYYLQANYLF
ncbi:MAG TPA: S-layer homology domain-containing protein [Negativicutes bacterium]|nr:S-layer homology domain-containing protein [Negativicutes bacterium]